MIKQLLKQPSGLAWMPLVPAHWTVKKLGLLALLKSGDSITTDEIKGDGPYPVYGGNGLRGYTDRFTHDGEYAVIGRQGALSGNINYAKGEFWASEHAVVVAPREEVAVRWLGELLRAMELNQYSVSAAQPGLSVETIAALKVPVPPLKEQRAIADYLDRETARLDALVAAKERVLGLLAEKRRALITRAVTRGLDPRAPRRDSGIPWLGEIPAHWKIRKFTRTVVIAEGQVDPEVEPYASMPLIAPDHIESGTGRLLKLETAADQGAISGKYLCSSGDVIYSKIRPALRKVTLAPSECLCSADMYPMKGTLGLSPQFLLLYLLAEPFSTWATLESARVAMPKINRDALIDVRIPCPPEEEQGAIVRHIEREISKIDIVRSATDRTIALLKERRSSLIAAAVAGQLNVGAAA